MDKKIKLGIIGAGRIGKLHAENIAANFKDVEIVAVCDPFADKIAGWAHSLGIGKVFADHMQVLEDSTIEAVLICSPTNTHSQITIQAARAGKHIFCEKPIDFDLGKIKDALKEVEKAKVKFQIGFNRRFDHNFGKVRSMVEAGNVGDVHIVKITSRDPQPPPVEYVKVSGGIFLDMTIHDFDMARFLSGSEVTEVYASAAVLVNPEIGEAGDVDTCIITLKFENGALGVIDNSRKAAYGYDQRVEVFGSKGCLTVSNDTDTSVVLSNGDAVISEKPRYFFLERYKDSFISEMRRFFDSVLEDRPISVTGQDGYKSILIGLAAKKSYEEGRPVKISEIEF